MRESRTQQQLPYMPMQTLSPEKEQNQITHSHSKPSSPPPTSSTVTTWYVAISFSAALEIASFFLPWVTFLGTELTGAAIQSNFPSYRLIWIVPLLAGITLLFNVARVPLEIVRRISGLCPFVILAVAINRLGSELLNELHYGAWFGLLAGALLTLLPGKPKE